MSHYRDHGPLDCKIYVGDLGHGAAKHELEDAFNVYGRLRNVWVARNPPGFAFVEFEDPRDAEDAIRALDGRRVCGRRVRVEMAQSSNKDKSRQRQSRGSSRHGGGGGGGDRERERSGRYGRSRSRSPRRRRHSRSRSRSRRRSHRSRSKSADRKSRSQERRSRSNSHHSNKSPSPSRSSGSLDKSATAVNNHLENNSVNGQPSPVQQNGNGMVPSLVAPGTED